MTELMWFRRDLRLTDNPALARAAAGGEVVGLFVLDPALSQRRVPSTIGVVVGFVEGPGRLDGWRPPWSPGDPASRSTARGRRRSRAVHVSADFGPYGRRRDASVSAALSQTRLPHRNGLALRHCPGSGGQADGSAYQVFTLYKAWLRHVVASPLAPAPSIQWRRPSDVPGSAGVEIVPEPPAAALPCDVGERAAQACLGGIQQDGLTH